MYSGLVLLTYVFTHLLNTSMGMISVDAMERGLRLVQPLWNPWGFGVVVPAATLVHLSVVLWQIYRMPRISLSKAEITRLLMGLSIPYVLIAHYWGSHVIPGKHGFEPDYASSIYSLLPPMVLTSMLLLIILAWGHGCLGVHFWLRFRSWYPRFLRIAIVPAVALPVFAMAGFAGGAREIRQRTADPAARQALLERKGASTEEQMVADALWEGNVSAGAYTAFLILVFGARSVHHWLRKRQRTIRIVYADGTEVLVFPGTTVLNASRLAGIPHAAMCGGRGRCSTCRVRIMEGASNLPEPTDTERHVLARVGAAPNVRLACSVSPRGEIRVTPLISGQSVPAHRALETDDYDSGRETDLAILFADLRGFTRMAEHKLPYDVVFLLNQYFQLMGSAIQKEHGHVDKFIGDGIMALFGLKRGLSQGCRDALRAAAGMQEQLVKLNERLQHDLPEPLGMGIAIHCGHVIAGKMGHGETVGLTAIGDPVNTASRLEGMTRDLGCALIISEDVRRAAGLHMSDASKREVSLRGRTAPMQIYAVQDAGELFKEG